MSDRSTAKARVHCEYYVLMPRGKYISWVYETIDSDGKVVDRDGTGNWRTIFDQAFQSVTVVRAIENMGHELQYDYDELVDREADRDEW